MLTRVLVIDDDTAMTEMLKVTLEPRAFEVLTAHTGEQGIEAAKTQNPDVIILDLMLPGKDGFTVCREIKENLSSLLSLADS